MLSPLHVVCQKPRDYFDEIMASVNIASHDWKVSNLCPWNDIVLKIDQAAASAGNGNDGNDRTVEEYEAEAEAAEFAMVKSKLAIFGISSLMISIFDLNVSVCYRSA